VAVGRWLRDEVAPVYDAMQADPRRGLAADQVDAALRAHHAAQLQAGVARSIVFAPEALAGLRSLYGVIADASLPERALAYVEELQRYCLGLADFPERGTRRDAIRPVGLRAIG